MNKEKDLKNQLEQSIVGYNCKDEPIKGKELSVWVFNALIVELTEHPLMQAFLQEEIVEKGEEDKNSEIVENWHHDLMQIATEAKKKYRY